MAPITSSTDHPVLAAPITRARLVLPWWWLPLSAALVSALALNGVPLLAPGLSPPQVWLTAALAVAGIVASLAAHGAAHLLVARWLRVAAPAAVRILPFGDAAQQWVDDSTPWRDLLVALAGPICHLALAGAGYIVWNAQWHPVLSTAATLILSVNGALALISLAPGLPFDGARVLIAVLRELGAGAAGLRLARVLGWLSGVGLMAWAGALLAAQARFSLPSAAAVLTLALVVLLTLWRVPAAPRAADVLLPASRGARWFTAGFMVLLQASGPLSMVPLLDGIYAPGPAVSVEPMITLPAGRAQPREGTFLLTTVISQTPITLGQWLYARIDPAYELVPPERVVPPDMAPQEVVRRNYQMLEASEAAAIVAALRLAGYPAELGSTAVAITEVPADGLNAAIVRPGDIITALDGAPITTPESLVAQLALRRAGEQISLAIDRDGATQTVVVTLLPPAGDGRPPRIGIGIAPHGLALETPFEVRIAPQKIVGGPSAGLMFTLTIYNLLADADLTQGRRIAGTGTIDADGNVGPIGGVAQKVAAAESAGATVFLVPRENAADARRVARRITIVEVSSAREAIDWLRVASTEQDPQAQSERWRGGWDLNPRGRVTPYGISSAAH